ncbi:hypothetical protein RCK87_25670, partial [Salmonella enterica subsp. enterica serovar 1,4,[5],12:i:-]
QQPRYNVKSRTRRCHIETSFQQDPIKLTPIPEESVTWADRHLAGLDSEPVDSLFKDQACSVPATLSPDCDG